MLIDVAATLVTGGEQLARAKLFLAVIIGSWFVAIWSLSPVLYLG